ncbi:MAG: DNA polymerase III subunit delta [Spirochaetes bacterium]|nr:DNA polymerase III subunit delta [Spirochaetota bacterium]
MTVKYPNAGQFKRELDSDRLERIYLFLGEEEGEKDKAINRITVMAFSDPNERSLATGRFHIENDDFMAAADFALSPPLFSSRRICIMYNIDSLPYARHKAVFQDLVVNLPDSAMLIMTSHEIRPPAFMAELLDRFKVVQFWRYFDKDIYNYILASFRKLGLPIDDRAVDILVERTGNDIKKIDDAIDMIRFSGETGRVDAEMIQYFIPDQKDANVFEFVDALFKKDTHALSLFKRIFEDGTPDLRVVYQVLRQAEIIEKYYSLAEEGAPAEEAMARAGVYSKNRGNFWLYTKAFPRSLLRRVFPLISATDYKLKSGGASKDLPANPVFNLANDILFMK